MAVVATARAQSTYALRTIEFETHMHVLRFGNHQLSLKAQRYAWAHGLGVEFHLSEAGELIGHLRVLCRGDHALYSSLSALNDEGLIASATRCARDWLARQFDKEKTLEDWKTVEIVYIRWQQTSSLPANAGQQADIGQWLVWVSTCISRELLPSNRFG
jgi:hypothetical protein